MSKLWNYIVLTMGLTLMLKLAGISTGLDWLLNTFGLVDGDVSNSAFRNAVIALFGISTGASIIVGLFGRTAPDYAIVAPFATANLIVFLSTFVAVMNYTSSFDNWLRYPIFAIFSVLSVGFLITTVEWVFGKDN